MRLYLSSFRLGNHAYELRRLLAGGSRVAIIANADDYKADADRRASAHREMADLAALRLEPVEIDLREYFGRRGRLREVLTRFDGLWVRGGNPFILRRALRYSGADEIIAELLPVDAFVYAGYSAGLAMLGPSLHGIDLIDSPDLIPDSYEPEVIWDCLGLLPYMVVPHYRSEHPESADAERSVQYMIDHHVLFLALSDGQVIVRDGQRETVLA